jgi:hypothetical protein
MGILERGGHKAVLINDPFDAALSVADLEIVRGHADAGPVAPSDVTPGEE